VRCVRRSGDYLKLEVSSFLNEKSEADKRKLTIDVFVMWETDESQENHYASRTDRRSVAKMDRGFVREQDVDGLEDLPDRPISEHPNDATECAASSKSRPRWQWHATALDFLSIMVQGAAPSDSPPHDGKGRVSALTIKSEAAGQAFGHSIGLPRYGRFLQSVSTRRRGAPMIFVGSIYSAHLNPSITLA
jgi:hypothetical protein